MASAASLPEPHVLAHAKRRLFPDPGEEQTYAVVDTQFAVEEWLDGERIDPQLRERLAPFNHVQVGSGYPDLVGVRSLEPELLAVERFGDQPPLVVVEAKGHSQRGSVDVERGVVQAYDRLHEANAAYVAAPGEAVSQSARTLARELNVGVLAVDADGSVTPLEVPRVVWAYPATRLFVEELQTMYDDGVSNPSLVDLVEWLHVQHPAFTVELFLRGSDDVRSRVLDEAGDIRRAALADGSVFHSPTVFQLKAMLYHSGILTERGAEPHRLDPTTDVWQLREPLEVTG